MAISVTPAEIEALKEEVAWLRSEVGEIRDLQIIAQLCDKFALRPMAARLVMALYGAKGRVMDPMRIVERIGSRDECGKTPAVLVCKIRRSMGNDAIETVWNLGFRITDKGAEMVRTAIGPLAI